LGLALKRLLCHVVHHITDVNVGFFLHSALDLVIPHLIQKRLLVQFLASELVVFLSMVSRCVLQGERIKSCRMQLRKLSSHLLLEIVLIGARNLRSHLFICVERLRIFCQRLHSFVHREVVILIKLSLCNLLWRTNRSISGLVSSGRVSVLPNSHLMEPHFSVLSLILTLLSFSHHVNNAVSSNFVVKRILLNIFLFGNGVVKIINPSSGPVQDILTSQVSLDEQVRYLVNGVAILSEPVQRSVNSIESS